MSAEQPELSPEQYNRIREFKLRENNKVLDEVIAKFEDPDTISIYHQIRSRPGVFDRNRNKAEQSLSNDFAIMALDLFKLYDDQKPLMEDRAVAAASFSKYGKKHDLQDPAYLAKLKEAQITENALDSVHILALTGVKLLERFRESGYEFQNPAAQAWLVYRQANNPSVT